jgi:hypothetical protein
MTYTEKQKSLFARASDGNKKAQAKILRDNLFDEWVNWNVQVRTVLDACDFACQISRIGIQRPNNDSFDKLFDDYMTVAAMHIDEATEKMANACMETLFAEVPWRAASVR